MKCHTFPGMGDRTLKDTSRTIQFFFEPKVLIHPGGPLKWLCNGVESDFMAYACTSPPV
jgi:hypothetical protein